MKICPVCNANFADDSLAFCLNDGTPLVSAAPASNFGASGLNLPPPKNSNLPIIAAILGGFVLLAVVVGALGIYAFRDGGKPPTNDKLIVNTNFNAAPKTENPVAEQINAKKQNSPSAANVKNESNTVISSSSVRQPEKGNFYYPNFAFDKNPATAWCEGTGGAGVGEWLQFNFGREVSLKSMNIQPGYFKNSEAWQKNNRVAAVTVEFSNRTIMDFEFPDEMTAQTIAFDNVRTESVKITITDFYPGSTDAQDTLISEVSFVTNP